MVVSQILLSPSVPISLCQSLHTDGNPASYFTKTIPHKNVQSFPNPQLLTSLHRCHIMSSLFRRQRWGWGTYTRTEHNKTWAIELIKTHIYKDSRALSPWIPKHFFSIHLYIRNLPLQKMCVPHVHWDDPILPPPPVASLHLLFPITCTLSSLSSGSFLSAFPYALTFPCKLEPPLFKGSLRSTFI